MQAISRTLLLISSLGSLWLTGCGSRLSGGQPVSSVGSVAEDELVSSTQPGTSVNEGTGVAVAVAAKPSTEHRESKETPPIIGQLKSRKHTIIIHVSDDGPRFTVTTPDGRVVAAALSSHEMRARQPEIYETYKSTFAQNGSLLDASNSIQPLPAGPFIDASQNRNR